MESVVSRKGGLVVTLEEATHVCVGKGAAISDLPQLVQLGERCPAVHTASWVTECSTAQRYLPEACRLPAKAADQADASLDQPDLVLSPPVSAAPSSLARGGTSLAATPETCMASKRR
jgi:hypothetical protein